MAVTTRDSLSSADRSEEKRTARRPAQFATTRWSVVLHAGRAGSRASSARDALPRLCRTYWFPLYAHVRRRGFPAHDAEDLTQEFFARLLARQSIAQADPARGRFRAFILTALNHFLSDERDRARTEKRGGTHELLSLDLADAEERFAQVADPVAPPDRMLDREWALTVLRTVLNQVAANKANSNDATNALSRDIAAALRASQPQGDIVLLTSPNSSTAIGYYGRFKTLGTLYWENSEGLKSAAKILGAGTEAEAATLIRTHRVTHIAIVSEENFIAQYYRLLHPATVDSAIRDCLGFRLMRGDRAPPWLQMLPYQVPEDLTALNAKVMLFKVAFE